MVKVLLLFGNPVDKLAFDQHFEDSHYPLLLKIPKLDFVQVNRVAGAVIGNSLYHLVVELHFPSEEAMQEGLNSESGQVMARDFGGFASGGVTVLVCSTRKNHSL